MAVWSYPEAMTAVKRKELDCLRGLCFVLCKQKREPGLRVGVVLRMRSKMPGYPTKLLGMCFSLHLQPLAKLRAAVLPVLLKDPLLPTSAAGSSLMVQVRRTCFMAFIFLCGGTGLGLVRIYLMGFVYC